MQRGSSKPMYVQEDRISLGVNLPCGSSRTKKLVITCLGDEVI